MTDFCACRVAIQCPERETIRALRAAAEGRDAEPQVHRSRADWLHGRLAHLLAIVGVGPARQPSPRLLQFLNPMPEQLRSPAERRQGLALATQRILAHPPSGEDSTAALLAEYPDWWRWLTTNWGPEYEPRHIDVEETASEHLVLHFTTEVVPPIPALRNGAERHGFSFRLTYWDGNLAGWASDTEEGAIEFDYTRNPAEQGVPTDVIENHRLNDVHRGYLDGTL